MTRDKQVDSMIKELKRVALKSGMTEMLAAIAKDEALPLDMRLALVNRLNERFAIGIAGLPKLEAA